MAENDKWVRRYNKVDFANENIRLATSTYLIGVSDGKAQQRSLMMQQTGD